MSQSIYYTLALCVGVATHVFYFNRYEFHRQISTIAFLLLIASSSYAYVSARLLGVWSGSVMTVQTMSCCLIGALGSTFIYRFFLNPLNRFPGPYSARLTDFYMAFQCYEHLDQYKRLDLLHKKYGPYVRIGANQLSIVDSNLVVPAYERAQHSGVTKAPWYDFDWPVSSLLSERTPHGHSKRRHMWAPAFSDKALHQYEKKVSKFNDKLLSRVEKLQCEQGYIDVSELFGLYSFDVMGSLVFGEDYKMLENHAKHSAFELLTEGLSMLGLSLPIWFILLLKLIPFDLHGAADFNSFLDAQVERAVKTRRFSVDDAVRKLSRTVRSFSVKSMPKAIVRRESFVGKHLQQTAQRKKFDTFIETQVQQKIDRRRSVAQGKAEKSTEDQRSILHWVLKTYGDQPDLEHDSFLRTDARLLIIAGSDTTCSALTYLFYELAKHPSDAAKIREEVKNCIKESVEWTETDIRCCHHLNGAINEALRLHPPGPSGVHRTTPAKGLQVGEVFLPGGIGFQIPFATLYRDEDIYADAHSFIPERWYSQPEKVACRKSFVPFLAGPNSCLGKNLAMIELRTLTTRILLEYDVSLAPGEDGSRLLFDSKDHFTMSLKRLDIVFSPLQRGGEDSFGTLNALRAVGARRNFADGGLRRQSSLSRDTIPEAPEETMQSWHW